MKPPKVGPSLSRRGGELVLRLLEQSDPVIGGANLATHDPATRQEMLASGALLAGQPARSITLFDDEDATPRNVDLEWLADREAYGYFTPDGYVVPDPIGLQSYRLNIDWYLKWLAAELDFAGTAIPFELVKGEAWDLGNLWVSRKSKVPILFARRLKHHIVAKKLIDALSGRAGRSGGLILTSSQRSPELAVWPHRFQVRSVADLLSQDANHFKLDHELITGMFSPSSAAHSAERVSLSPDLRSLVIDGKVMNFRGAIQQKIIHLLVESYRKGERLRTSEVLMKAGSQAPDFAKAFKNNPSWPSLSRYVKTKQGSCWIEL